MAYACCNGVQSWRKGRILSGMRYGELFPWAAEQTTGNFSMKKEKTEIRNSDHFKIIYYLKLIEEN